MKQRRKQQFSAIFAVMKRSKWFTLSELSDKTGFPPQSISARIRDFRKQQYGKHVVNRRYLGNGLWEYQLVPAQ